MPIYELLRGEVFEPEDLSVLIDAYVEILAGPAIPRPSEAVAETIARKIIATAKTGERDKARIVEQVISEL